MTYLDTRPTGQVEQALAKARERGFRALGGRDMLAAASGDEKYALWLLIADTKCGGMIGLGIFDLADYVWADAYANGDSPRTAVLDALANDDTFSHFVREMGGFQ